MIPKTSSPRNSISFSAAMDAKIQATQMVPTDKDVLLGRGRTNFFHRGNVRFREIVGSKLHAYLSATSRSSKSKIVREIADEVLAESRFLKQDEKTFVWHDAGLKATREKVGHALRDASSDKSRSIKNIHLKLLHNRKIPQTKHLSVVEAARLSLNEASDWAVSNIDAGMQSLLRPYGWPMDSCVNDEFNAPLDFDSMPLPLDPAANKFTLPFQADQIFSDGLYNDLINLDHSTSPDFSRTSLDEYLEVVNEIELDDLEAYLDHVLDCTKI